MEKSIESIWKDGFLNPEALIAPRLNNFYDKKSIHVIDKLSNMFKWNLILLMVAAMVILGVSYIGGALWSGIATFILLSWLVWHSKKRAETLQIIDKGKNSYDYLSNFSEWLEAQITAYIKIYRFLYPALIATISLGIIYSDLVYDMLQSNDNIFFYEGHPLYFTIGLLIYSALFGIFAGPIYRMDLGIVYGSTLNKMKELIADMEELRKEP